MKKFLAIIVIVFSQSVFAGEQAKETIKAKLAALQTFSADFKQTVTDATGEELQTAEGKIYLSQPQKLYWETAVPNEMQLIADGDTLWHVDPFVEQVIAIDQKNAAQNHPVMLLAQQDSSLWSKYLVEKSGENQFLLTSINSESDFISLTMTFKDERLIGLSILDKMEQRNTLEFYQVIQNTSIDQQIFQFTLPEGYDLDDQR